MAVSAGSHHWLTKSTTIRDALEIEDIKIGVEVLTTASDILWRVTWYQICSV